MATEQARNTEQEAATQRNVMRGTAESQAPTVLSVEDLWVEYRTPAGWLGAVRGVSFDIRQGEAVALIGESGSGKSTLGFALLRMLVRTARVSKGKATYRDRNGKTLDLLNMKNSDFRKFRWRECAMVFQAAQ
ncbi:MAG: ATP-binding cassette domain-containing protein, partial [Chloroflexia bacterium]|nr:ATP-binding cassette domain-containing protein [Chloroflexia bacterium]